MRLVLNKVASENIADLFPTDWHPRPTMSDVQVKQYKVPTGVRTEMFQQCGYVPEDNVIETDNYQHFLKVLQHHTFIVNISTIQLTQFIMLMVYMSFFRLNYYARDLTDNEANLLKEAVQMSLVVMSFKTTFSMKGGYKTINKNVHATIMYSVTSTLQL